VKPTLFDTACQHAQRAVDRLGPRPSRATLRDAFRVTFLSGYEAAAARFFTWVAWADTPRRWSKDHLTADGRRTLCGVRIPPFPFDRSDSHSNPCRRCLGKAPHE